MRRSHKNLIEIYFSLKTQILTENLQVIIKIFIISEGCIKFQHKNTLKKERKKLISAFYLFKNIIIPGLDPIVFKNEMDPKDCFYVSL